jgi:hypothetical protein
MIGKAYSANLPSVSRDWGAKTKLGHYLRSTEFAFWMTFR